MSPEAWQTLGTAAVAAPVAVQTASSTPSFVSVNSGTSACGECQAPHDTAFLGVGLTGRQWNEMPLAQSMRVC